MRTELQGRISEQEGLSQEQFYKLRSIVMKSLNQSRKEKAINDDECEDLRDFIASLDIDTFCALFIAFGDCVMQAAEENGVLIPVSVVEMHVFDVQD